MNGHTLLADLLVGLHFLYVAFVVGGEVLILLGALLRWRWVRNPWFRFAHLLAIGVVVFQVAAGLPCPLTVWEADLRRTAGQPVEAGSFVGRLLHEIVFVEASARTLAFLHVGFGVLVLGTLALCPPRLRRAPGAAAGR